MNSLYIHVPFCARRCDYCAFYTLAGIPADTRSRYLDRLDAEMAAGAPRCHPLDHIYIGGGTPTHLKPPELDRLFASIHRHFRLAPGAEFSIEANPLTFDAPKLDRLLAAGITRLSLGVQSFNPATRAAIGRAGDPDKVHDAIALLRHRGFTNYNCDLIYGAPGQTLADLDADLDTFLTLTPAHVSTYSLMVEAGTPLAQRGAHEADDELLADMWRLIAHRLGTLGLQRYEVSNFARPGHECRHNLHVWRGGHFLGIGPSACWYDGIARRQNPPDLDLWLAAAPTIDDHLPPDDRAAEILAYGFRIATGWTPAAYHAATGRDYHTLRGPALAALVEEGSLEEADGHLRIPLDRLLFADHVARELL